MAKSKKRKKSHPVLRRLFWRTILVVVLAGALAGGAAYGVGHMWLARLEYGVHYQDAQMSASAKSAAPADVQAQQHEFGIAFGATLQSKDGETLMRQLGDTAHLGFKWVRFDVEWKTVQPEGPTAYDWSAYDRIVSAARQQGLQSLPTLAYAPAWARQSACKTSDKCAPANPKQFADFAHAAAAHFAPDDVHTWEIWNEPNSSSFWKPTPDASAYAALLKATYPAIKSADVDATVITGGLSSTSSAHGQIEQVDFLKDIYQAGGKDSFDAVGYHPYSAPVLPSTVKSWSGWSRMNETGSKTMRAIMQANGDGAKQVWATEYGAATKGLGSEATRYGYNPLSKPDHTDEQWQSAMASAAIQYTRKNSWMGPLFWYSYQDLGTDSRDNKNFFGLLRADGTHKPAYNTFFTELN